MAIGQRSRGWQAPRSGFAFLTLFSLLLSLSCVLSAHADETRVEAGKLTRKDQKLNTGEFYETFDLPLTAGQSITLDLRSTEFDPFIQLDGLDAEGNYDEARRWFNDDFESSTERSVVTVEIPVAGNYRIMVTSKAADEIGAYELTITTRDVQAPVNPVREVWTAREQIDLSTIEGRERRLGEGIDGLGELKKGDETFNSGEYYDTYLLQLSAGERILVDLTTEDFDPYLIIRPQSDPDSAEVNDDYDNSNRHSYLEYVPAADGVYEVIVTSYEAEETGKYRLRATLFEAGANVAGSAASTRQEQGRLEKGDGQLNSGEYADVYLIQGVAGQSVRITLTSSDFDTYLILRAPSGEQVENDDLLDDKSTSVIETLFTENGEYRLLVTSYAKGETGDYRLAIELSAGGVQQDGLLETGSRIEGEITDSDEVFEMDRRGDTYYFTAEAGDYLRVKLFSEDFDSLIKLIAPDGTEEVFDDEGDDRNAGINQRASQTGKYTLIATGYDAISRGRYLLSFDRSSGDSPVAGKRILGVFVGIAEYPEGLSDLALCDVDAQTIYSLLRENYGMRVEDSVLLVNQDATVDALRNALQKVGSAAGPNDLVVFFYSGHGGQVTAEESQADPDGINETLALVDGQMTDDEFAELINASRAGTVLVALDSCFSGGFAKDVVSTRGRLGIFSSEEDVVSNVAEEFEAGGFLSRFLADALLEHRDAADLNSDKQLTAHELCHYLSERYREDVRSKAVKSGVGGIDPSQDLSFQKLVVDRGGVHFSEVLFRW